MLGVRYPIVAQEVYYLDNTTVGRVVASAFWAHECILIMIQGKCVKEILVTLPDYTKVQLEGMGGTRDSPAAYARPTQVPIALFNWKPPSQTLVQVNNNH